MRDTERERQGVRRSRGQPPLRTRCYWRPGTLAPFAGWTRWMCCWDPVTRRGSRVDHPPCCLHQHLHLHLHVARLKRQWGRGDSSQQGSASTSTTHRPVGGVANPKSVEAHSVATRTHTRTRAHTPSGSGSRSAEDLKRTTTAAATGPALPAYLLLGLACPVRWSPLGSSLGGGHLAASHRQRTYTTPHVQQVTDTAT